MDLVLLFSLGALQNAAFTWSGRSRNSGDVTYHALAALFSNGLWFLMTVVIWERLWASVIGGDWQAVAMTGFIYVAGTVLGSCSMMWLLLKTETGRRRVGAQ